MRNESTTNSTSPSKIVGEVLVDAFRKQTLFIARCSLSLRPVGHQRDREHKQTRTGAAAARSACAELSLMGELCLRFAASSRALALRLDGDDDRDGAFRSGRDSFRGGRFGTSLHEHVRVARRARRHTMISDSWRLCPEPISRGVRARCPANEYLPWSPSFAPVGCSAASLLPAPEHNLNCECSRENEMDAGAGETQQAHNHRL